MATILFSAVGASVGASFGGTVLGLTGATIGRAIGATIGQAIDQRLLGVGSRAVETGRIDRLRITGAGEGSAIARVWGRVRIGGHVIWASRFLERVTQTSGGGKGGGPSGPDVTAYSYSVSVAVALCEGEIARVGRIWADGRELARGAIGLRVYRGTEDQLPDPKIEAIEGAGNAPAYRGLAYVVIEDLDLAPFGNRVPVFSFEVVRFAARDPAVVASDLAQAVRAVALIPGTGEYGLATTPLHTDLGAGVVRSVNVNSASGISDFATALVQLTEEAPRCGAVSLVVSWFGDDLRAGQCEVRPKVENAGPDAVGAPWRAGGIGRAGAQVIARLGGRPVYGGTPSDASVIEAINALRAAGQAVMFYPFVLMEQLAGNGRTDPYTGAADQPVLPWRGRITTSVAPGREGSPDRTAAAEAEVAAFFGTTQPGDITVVGGEIRHAGPDQWGYRRFILHYAHLCALAGGVDAFCVGSELRGLTAIRGAGDSFPAVEALRRLVGEVRAILGPGVRISYAADWSEYFGHVDAEGNRYFHLDPLWSDPDVDFVGIDNYMPLSDWRDGEDHADALAGVRSIYDPAYLKAGIEGGEGFDWYYPDEVLRASQTRLPITDGAYGEPWIWRWKDIRSWWENRHHERRGGVRAEAPTGWVPRSKPIWFTEIGCPAVDKGTNQPNKFVDPKSSESQLPYFSGGQRDDTIQMQYLRALSEYWDDPARNPVSGVYGGPMVDTARAFVWAWDARPFPQFPANGDLWGDGANYALGHWISGRMTNQPLAAVVAEICAEAGVREIDVSGLHGVVRGFQRAEVGTARAALQSLMLAHGFEARARDGVIRFVMRDGRLDRRLTEDDVAEHPDFAGAWERVLSPEAEMAGRVRIGFVEAEGDFETAIEETILADDTSDAVAQTDLPMVLTRGEGLGISARWLAEARVAREGVRLALPPSRRDLGPGDVIALGTGAARYRIDRVERAGAQLIEAVRIEPGLYRAARTPDLRARTSPAAAALPVHAVFLDLPILTGREDPVAPHLAVTALPWQGDVALWESESDQGYRLNGLWSAPATVGVTLSDLAAAPPGIWDRGPALRLRLGRGTLASAAEAAVLAGGNALAIGDGTAGRWEVLQFRDAVPVAAGVWDISMRLRGQAGTDGVMPPVWPAGSTVVLLDGAARQIAFASAERGLARSYRIGVAARGIDDRTAIRRVEVFQGVGLRPYAPAHLRLRRAAGALEFGWIRRTRIDGDGWAAEEVPLGEAFEAYRLRVLRDGATLREETVATPAWSYPDALRAADGAVGRWRFEVAQMSDRFGPGPFTGIAIDD